MNWKEQIRIVYKRNVYKRNVYIFSQPIIGLETWFLHFWNLITKIKDWKSDFFLSFFINPFSQSVIGLENVDVTFVDVAFVDDSYLLLLNDSNTLFLLFKDLPEISKYIFSCIRIVIWYWSEQIRIVYKRNVYKRNVYIFSQPIIGLETWFLHFWKSRCKVYNM